MSLDYLLSRTNRDEATGIRTGDLIAMAALTLTALLIRLYFLRAYDVISTDGTGYARAALALRSGDVSGLSVSGFYPVLVWLAHYLVSDIELAGRIVSIIFGSLLVIPLYLLGSELFSRPVAIAACLTAMIWPTLLGWSCEVMTQATYTTMVLGGVYLVWRMSRGSSPGWGCAAGTLLGLAYLTRPEALLIFLAAPMVPLFARYREIRARWLPLAAYLGSFLLLASLNVLLVRQVTGHWQLSAKTASALNDALAYYLNIPDLNYIPTYRAKGYLDILRDYPGFLWSNILKNSKEAWHTILPFPIRLVTIAGFLAGGFSRAANVTRLFLLATFAPLAVIITFYYIGPEYTQPYIPVLFLWAAAGAVTLGKALIDRLPPAFTSRWTAYQAASLAVMTVAVIYSGMLLFRQISAMPANTPYHPEQDGGRRDQKNIGLVLKQHLPPGKIMTRWGRIAFYADREWVNIPHTSHEAIMVAARENKVRFLIIDGDLDKHRPGLSPELFKLFGPEYPQTLLATNTDNTARVMPGLLPFFIYRDPSSSGVVVYEVVPD